MPWVSDFGFRGSGWFYGWLPSFTARADMLAEKGRQLFFRGSIIKQAVRQHYGGEHIPGGVS